MGLSTKLSTGCVKPIVQVDAHVEQEPETKSVVVGWTFGH